MKDIEVELTLEELECAGWHPRGYGHETYDDYWIQHLTDEHLTVSGSWDARSGCYTISTSFSAWSEEE